MMVLTGEAVHEGGDSGKENNEGHDALSPGRDAECSLDLPARLSENDPDHLRNREIIASSTPTTELELALKAELDRLEAHNALLAKECAKYRTFVQKRRQTYKRKHKDEGAPRKKLSGYNMFVKERFAQLKKENEEALKNADGGAELKRIAPSSNIASSGKAWSRLSDEEKARYNALAKPDEDRFAREVALYRSPNRNRKRPVTGYNIFFSEYVRERKEKGEWDELKEEEDGADKDRRGTVARVVGDAWKALSEKKREEYERRAEEKNEAESPVATSGEDPRRMNRESGENDSHNSHPGGCHPPPRVDRRRPPSPIHHGRPRRGPDLRDGQLAPPPPPQGMPPPYPLEYGMHPGPPPPHGMHPLPPGYEGYPPYGPMHPYPPDPYGYPPPHPYPPPPPGAEGPPWIPPPPEYQNALPLPPAYQNA